MTSDDPVQQKRLGGKLQIKDDTWNSRKVMKTAVRAKFHQNPDLKGYLKNTAPMTLVHANAYDQHWANGLAITSKDVLNASKYSGLNILGDILMEIRDEL